MGPPAYYDHPMLEFAECHLGTDGVDSGVSDADNDDFRRPWRFEIYSASKKRRKWRGSRRAVPVAWVSSRQSNNGSERIHPARSQLAVKRQRRRQEDSAADERTPQCSSPLYPMWQQRRDVMRLSISASASTSCHGRVVYSRPRSLLSFRRITLFLLVGPTLTGVSHIGIALNQSSSMVYSMYLPCCSKLSFPWAFEGERSSRALVNERLNQRLNEPRKDSAHPSGGRVLSGRSQVNEWSELASK